MHKHKEALFIMIVSSFSSKMPCQGFSSLYCANHCLHRAFLAFLHPLPAGPSVFLFCAKMCYDSKGKRNLGETTWITVN